MMIRSVNMLAKAFTVVVVVCIGSFSPVLAKEPAVILIVDFDTLFSDSKVAKDVNSQAKKMAEKIEKENVAAIESFKKEVEKLRSQRNVISDELLNEKVADLQKRQEQHQVKMQKKVQALQLGGARARSEIEAVLRPVFAEVMKHHKGSIMLDQRQVLAGGVDLNVTDEIMSVLNERLSSLKVKPVDPETLKKN